MTIPSYLAFFVVTGSIGTIAAVIFGLNQALKRASWPVRERRRTVQATSLVLTAWFALAVALASLGVYHVPGDRLPTIEFGIVIPILVGCLILWRSPVVSRAIDVTPREWVIAVQVFRVEGVIFLMSVDSVDEADRLLKALPLGQANLLTFDLMPIGPLLPLGMLINAH